MQLRELSGQAGRALRLSRRRLAQVDLDRLPVPDTRAAKDAEEICRALPAHIANHSHRTYLWGAVLAAHDGIEYDPELLYVACLLHDAGLPAAVEAGDERCFTVRSSELASERSAAAGWSPARQDAVAESITLHLNPSVGVDLGPEAHLVNAGAALDIVGMRRGQIGRDTARAVVQRHPRAALKEEFVSTMRAHTSAAPGTRGHALMRYGAFGMLIRRAPFDG